MLPGPKFNLSLSARAKLADKLRQGNAVLSFTENPALAGLCTCIGLEFEMGNPNLDRLSPFFGIDVSRTNDNPWLIDIFTREEDLGICFTPKDGRILSIKHPDFRHVIAEESFNEQGDINRIVIYPNRVAGNYAVLGFELVIVRDWLLATALQTDPNQCVSYLYVNPWEIKFNISRMQVALMSRMQLAFFGTHDIVDHLLDANKSLYHPNLELFRSTENELNRIFDSEVPPSLAQLSLSYLVGVLLDDLAQPKWYRSEPHRQLIRFSMNQLSLTEPKLPASKIDLPLSFHELMKEVRDHRSAPKSLNRQFELFLMDLGLK